MTLEGQAVAMLNGYPTANYDGIGVAAGLSSTTAFNGDWAAGTGNSPGGTAASVLSVATDSWSYWMLCQLHRCAGNGRYTANLFGCGICGNLHKRGDRGFLLKKQGRLRPPLFFVRSLQLFATLHTSTSAPEGNIGHAFEFQPGQDDLTGDRNFSGAKAEERLPGSRMRFQRRLLHWSS